MEDLTRQIIAILTGVTVGLLFMSFFIYMVWSMEQSDNERLEFLKEQGCGDHVTRDGIYYCLEDGEYERYIMEYTEDGYKLTKVAN